MLFRASKKWLSDYVQIEKSDQELSDILSLSGTLVENIENPLSNIIVGKILEINKHPNADKLRVIKVSDGKNNIPVVCGAPNIKVGQLVPLAIIGAKINGKSVAEVDIRGIRSTGMLCSEAELGVGMDANGVKILSNDFEVGKQLNEYFNSDTLFDIDITPNRGDCLCHLGIAREISVLLTKNIKKEPISLNSSGNISDFFMLKVSDSNSCPVYYAKILKGVKVGKSPGWLEKRLTDCGITPINNVVDATNYIMLDLGQPMHAYDATKIYNNKIIIRKSKNNEEFTTLDGSLLRLNSGHLIITDNKKVLALAGVVGGIDSSVDEKTSDVILEAAFFDSKSIRKTMKELEIKTDASLRFERGIDPNITEYAINKAASLIQKNAGGTILSGILQHRVEISPIQIKIEKNKINNLLETSLTSDEIKQTLKRLGFGINGDFAIVPSWRSDCSIWQDLAEEIFRVNPENFQKRRSIVQTERSQKSDYFTKELLKDLLVDTGYCEVNNYSFISDNDVKIFNLDAKNLIELENPIQPEYKYMRNSLLPALIKTVAKNPSFDPVLIFEIGRIFIKDKEISQLMVVASGKGADEAILEASEVIKGNFSENFEIHKLSSIELKKYKIRKPELFYFSLDLDEINKSVKINLEVSKLKNFNSDQQYKPVSKYPSVCRDLAFVCNKNTDSNKISTEIRDSFDKVIIAELFDQFTSDKIGKDKKNLAYHIYLQAKDKTLKDSEADQLIDEIIKLVKRKFKAVLRK